MFSSRSVSVSSDKSREEEVWGEIQLSQLSICSPVNFWRSNISIKHYLNSIRNISVMSVVTFIACHWTGMPFELKFC